MSLSVLLFCFLAARTGTCEEHNSPTKHDDAPTCSLFGTYNHTACEKGTWERHEAPLVPYAKGAGFVWKAGNGSVIEPELWRWQPAEKQCPWTEGANRVGVVPLASFFLNHGLLLFAIRDPPRH